MGDDFAFEMKRSTSPVDNYHKKDLVTESQTPVTGQEPVQAISYRHIAHTSLDQISGLVPTYATNMTTATTGALPTTVATTTTTTGYVNGGHSINFRARQTEPLEGSSGLGVGDVDFDTKCTEAYANLDDVRDRDYHSTTEAIYRGVPNRSKEKTRKAKVSCCFCSFVIFIFALEVVILVLGVFNLVNGLEVGSLTKSLIAQQSTSPTSSPQMSVVELDTIVKNLSRQLDEIRNNLKEYNSSHSTNIKAISLNLLSLNKTVANLSTSPSTSYPSPTAGPLNSNISIQLQQGCVTDRVDCTTSSGRVSNTNHPNFVSCNTPHYNHNATDTSVYLADVFCSVDTDNQVMPIASSLAITHLGYSCLCHGIEIPNVVQATLHVFRCFLHYTVCPTSIQVSVPLL